MSASSQMTGVFGQPSMKDHERQWGPSLLLPWESWGSSAAEADLAAEPSCQPIKTLEEASQLMQKSAQKINSASLVFCQFKPLKTGMCYGSWWPTPGNQHNEH